MAEMTCLDYISLRDDYEAAIRDWGKVMRLRDDDLARRAALDRRNDALSKMTRHIDSCGTCTREKASIVHGGDFRKH